MSGLCMDIYGNKLITHLKINHAMNIWCIPDLKQISLHNWIIDGLIFFMFHKQLGFYKNSMQKYYKNHEEAT